MGQFRRIGFLLCLVAGSGLAEAPDQPISGLDAAATWFADHPELTTTPGSGWNPFNRVRWFRSTREAPAGMSAAVLRQEAFEVARDRMARSPRGAGWFNAGPLEFSGRCTSIDFAPGDPSTVYVGTAGGGLWVSTDGGDTWTTTTDDLPSPGVGAVCLPSSTPGVVLLGTGEGNGIGYIPTGSGVFGVGMLRSTDGGATWETTSLSYPRAGTHGFSAIEENPVTGTILAAASDAVWRSTDAGQTWTSVLDDGNFFDVAWKPGASGTVFVTKGQDLFGGATQTDNGVFVSTDDGLTFTLAGTGQPPGADIGKTRIAIAPSSPDVIYAHYVDSGDWGTLGVYRSIDGGASWTLQNGSLNTGGQGWYNNALTVDPDDPDHIIVGGVYLYRSSNGGVSYTSINPSVPFGDDTRPHFDHHAIAYEPGSTTAVWVTTDGGPWRSDDDGVTWSPRRAGIISYQFYDICVAQSDPVFAMGGTQDNGIPGRSGEAEWFHSTIIVDGMVCNVHPEDPLTIYAEWQSGQQVKSFDGGQSWVDNNDGLVGLGAWRSPLALNRHDPLELYTCRASRIYRTRNGGEPWEQVSTHRATWIDVSPVDGDVVWSVHETSGLRVSTDGGDTWVVRASTPDVEVSTKVLADPRDADVAFVTYGGYGTGIPRVQRTDDLGLTWTDVTGDLPDIPVNTFVVDQLLPQDWYAGTDLGVWHSADGGASWVPLGTGLANAVITDLEIRVVDRKLVAGTFGRGMWEIDLAAAVAVADAGSPSRLLMLDRPYPQPARSRVAFRFASRSDGARLAIYDVTGREIDVVETSVRGDGVVRTLTWDASTLTPGVYFAVLRAGQGEVTRRFSVTP